MDNFGLLLGLMALVLAGLAMGGFYLMRQALRHRETVARSLAQAILGGLLGMIGSMGCFLTLQGLVAVGPSHAAMRGLVGETAPHMSWQSLGSGGSEAVDAAGDADGKRILSSLRGQVVLVNFWATWCPPCREEMPDLDRLQEELGPEGLVVLHLSDEEAETVRAYLEKNPMATRHGLVDAFPWPESGRPTTYVVDREGVVREAVLGARDYERFRAMVEPLLADG